MHTIPLRPLVGLAFMLAACDDFAATVGGDTSDLECSGHGHMHDDHCHCDAGYEVDPHDSTRCIPQ